MIRVVCIDGNGFPRDLGFKEGTVESVKRDIEDAGFKIISIQNEGDSE